MKIIIYGMGKRGKGYVDKCLSYGINTMKLTDSNSMLWGEIYQGIEIEKPKNVFEGKYDLVVVAVGNKYKAEVLRDLKNIYGVSSEKMMDSESIVMVPIGEECGENAVKLISVDKSAFGKAKYYDMWYEIYKTALYAMNIGRGGNVEQSGELYVLNVLKGIGRADKVIFDIGANIGEYTKKLLTFFPDAHIHSFEPSKQTFLTLSTNVNSSNVTLNNLGISNEVEKGVLYYDEDNSGLASLYNRQLDYLGKELSKTAEIELTTIDNYCEMHDIRKIDFIKMDIEGNEYKALQGARRMLKEKKIEAIQIEIGGANLDARIFFRDFWNFLHDDFSIYRILQDGIKEIIRYEEVLENFVTTNYFCLKKVIE